ncbi:putative acetyltransferase [Peptococcaceae bacterium CEB3]|nr:putative acetyltransferase [Peptococcaceae bacterium CEB3]
MPEVNIRLCQMADLPEVAVLMSELREVARGGEIDVAQIRTLFSEMEKLPEVYLNLIAETAEGVVGYLSVVFYKTVFHKGGTALINELIVTQSQRGKGIGCALVKKAKEEALARGLDEIEVGTENTNESAQRFYRACGFTEESLLMGMDWTHDKIL